MKKSPFVQFDNWHKSWLGEGRKIHCRTVFYKEVVELLEGLGVIVRHDPDCLVHTKVDGSLTFTTVFRFRGVNVINDRFDMVAPYFKCIQIIIDTTNLRESIDLKEGNNEDAANRIHQQLIKKWLI
jgi:hypothetical protein